MSINRTYLSISLSFSLLLALPPLKDSNIESFILARYEGDTMTVNSMISEDFIYEHTPYVGLGIEAYYVDGSAIITHIVDDSIQTELSVGDRIYEFNNEPIDSTGLDIKGSVGDIQKLIVTKTGDSTFSHLEIPLSRFQFKQDADSFLETIMKYSKVWYDYDVTIETIISKKNEVVVHYSWEGSKDEIGPTYHFTAIEIIELNKRKNLIERVVGLWSEKQFRDQFR